MALGRLHEALRRGEKLEVIMGSPSRPGSARPVPGRLISRLTYRSRTVSDRRGRVMLDYRARAWLAVADSNRFEVVAFPEPAGGSLVMPVEDFARRWG